MKNILNIWLCLFKIKATRYHNNILHAIVKSLLKPSVNLAGFALSLMLTLLNHNVYLIFDVIQFRLRQLMTSINLMYISSEPYLGFRSSSTKHYFSLMNKVEKVSLKKMFFF